MYRKMMLVMMLGFIICLSRCVCGMELQTKPFIYIQNFEEEDPITLRWDQCGSRDGSGFTINFKGITEEKKYSGKSSFKLDVTFTESGRLGYVIPLKIPAEGKLNMSARIFLGDETTGRKINLGTSFYFPPTTYSCETFKQKWANYNKSLKGEWQLLKGDLVKAGKELSEISAANQVWGAEGENTGSIIDCIALFLYANEGQRIVVYIDDIKIEGEVLTQTAFNEEIQRRWAPAKKKFDEKIGSWEKILEERGKEVSLLTNFSLKAEKIKKEIEGEITSLRARVKNIKKRGWIKLREPGEIEPLLELLKDKIANIRPIHEVKLDTKYLCYVVKPITNLQILPDVSSIPGKISDEMKIVACPGEYEPASFVLYALSDIGSLKVEPTDLKGEKSPIPSKCVDIRVVKCWYQAGKAHDINTGIKLLLPELLLKDDSLVKVDTKEKENYLKLSYPEGEKYVCISKKEGIHGIPTQPTNEEFPVKDASVLLPVNIPAGTNKQFWVTIKVPEETIPGIYTGEIRLEAAGNSLGKIKLKLRVLPIELAEPYYISSIYTGSRLSRDGKGNVDIFFKTEEQYKNEMENLFAHGVTAPQLTHHGQPYFDMELLEKELKIRAEIGMNRYSLFYRGYLPKNMQTGGCGYAIGNPTSENELNLLKNSVRKVVALAKSYGFPEVYFYGIDETEAGLLKSQRKAWEAVHKAGGKVYVAGHEGSGPDSHFELVGDIQDLFVCARYPKPEEVRKWHSVGHKICCYDNPQAGGETPETYRRNYGLLLWQNDYDGAMTWVYHWGNNNVWNDFDWKVERYREQVFVYPTVDGVIDTIQWEGYREGVDDVRYLTTLLKAIKENKNSKDRKIRKVVIEVEKYLKTLNVKTRNLDTIRLEMINYILKLTRGNK